MHQQQHETSVVPAELPGLFRAGCSCGWASPSGHPSADLASPEGDEHRRVQATRESVLRPPLPPDLADYHGHPWWALAVHFLLGVVWFFSAVAIDMSRYGFFCSGEPAATGPVFIALLVSWLPVAALVVWQARRGPGAWLLSGGWFVIALTIFAGVVGSGPEPDCGLF